MKKITLCLLSLLILTACQKEQPQPKVDPQVTQQFNQADNKLDNYLNIFDNPRTPKDQSTKFICEDYPKTYKNDLCTCFTKIVTNLYRKGLSTRYGQCVEFLQTKNKY